MLSYNEAQELESLHLRCLSKSARGGSRPVRSTSSTTCVNHISLLFHFEDKRGPEASHLTMKVWAYENGFEYNFDVIFTVFELPGTYQLLFYNHEIWVRGLNCVLLTRPATDLV